MFENLHKPVSRKLGVLLVLLVGILAVFAFGAYSDHTFLETHYRDSFDGVFFETEQGFEPAGPYRDDFDGVLFKTEQEFEPAGPYRADFDRLLRESETYSTPAGPYMADFH